MVKLVDSKVSFDELNHTYHIGDKQLSGITKILHKYLFSDMYAFVSDDLLARAAERGSLIHSQIQMMHEGFDVIEPELETIAFQKLNIKILASEYVVTDNKHVASPIDIVDPDINLYDIKTTSILNREYLSWQLSIYAYLFELLNPTLKVGKLYGIHLRGDSAKLVEVQRIDNHVVSLLLDAFVNGDETFVNPLKALTTSEEQLVEKAQQIECAIILLKETIDKYEATQKELKSLFKKMMDEKGITKWETENIIVTRRADSERKTLDSDMIKSLYPDIAESCTKIQKVEGSVIFKIKQ